MTTTTHTNSLSFVRADLSSHFQITGLVYYYFQKKNRQRRLIYIFYFCHIQKPLFPTLFHSNKDTTMRKWTMMPNGKIDGWWEGLRWWVIAFWLNWEWKRITITILPNQREVLMAFHLVIVVPSSPGGSPRLFSSIPLLMFRQFKFAHKLNSDPWINHFNDS